MRQLAIYRKVVEMSLQGVQLRLEIASLLHSSKLDAAVACVCAQVTTRGMLVLLCVFSAVYFRYLFVFLCLDRENE